MHTRHAHELTRAHARDLSLPGAHAEPHVLDGYFVEDRSSQAAVVVVKMR